MSSTSRQDGAAAVEMAFLAPLLVMIVMGMIDLGNALYARV
jgi:Flp pilus assembly protein TadG